LETVAVYAEHPIKTYGIKAEPGFMLLGAACKGGRLPGCLSRARDAGELARAVFSFCSRQNDGWRLIALIQAEQAKAATDALLECGLELNPPQPASLIHLQGPHFGDRYGLLAAASQGLETARVTPLVLQACMHSIFVVIEPGREDAAVWGLEQQFCSPGK
jgi:aspartokinase